MDIIRAQEQSRDLHEQFHHQLERSQDGFSVIADYYGRGVFNKVRLHNAPITRMGAWDENPHSSAADPLSYLQKFGWRDPILPFVFFFYFVYIIVPYFYA